LGCISQINEFDLLVSLPHELVGVVPMTEISDSFTTLVEKAAHEKDDDDEDENMEDSVDIDLNKRFHVGQWVRCRITSVTEEAKKKKVELSLKPNVVNEDILKADVTPGLVSCLEKKHSDFEYDQLLTFLLKKI
jgi:rRNA biogenesis protein RRP5